MIGSARIQQQIDLNETPHGIAAYDVHAIMSGNGQSNIPETQRLDRIDMIYRDKREYLNRSSYVLVTVYQAILKLKVREA
jgi:hypothetical protein